MSVSTFTTVAAVSSSTTENARQQELVGHGLGPGPAGAVVVGDARRGVTPAEVLVVVGAAEVVGDLGRQPDGPHGHQVGAAAQLAQHGDELHRAAREIVGQGSAGDAGEEGEPRRIDGGDDVLGGGAEHVEIGNPREVVTPELAAALEVGAGRRRRCHLGPTGRPEPLDERGVEVAEGADHHAGLDVAHDAAPAEEVEAEAVETQLLADGERLRVEVEGTTEGRQLGGGRR